MNLASSLSALCLLTPALTINSASAQDQFGSAVAVDGNQVVILKATNARGPATIYVFSATAHGDWQADAEFYPAAANETGEGFNASLAATDGLMLVGSGP